MPEFENIIYTDADRLAILENRAAELERLLLLVTRPEGDAHPNVAVPCNAVPEGGERHAACFQGRRLRGRRSCGRRTDGGAH